MRDAIRVFWVVAAWVGAAFERWTNILFRERDLLLRSGGAVHYVRLTARLQLSLTLLAVMALIWVGGATYIALDQKSVIRSGLDEINEIKAAYKDLLGEASHYQEKVALLAGYSERAIVGFEDLQRIVTMAGLDSKILMSRVEYSASGQGGPFIAAPADAEVATGALSNEREELANALLNLETNLGQWELLRKIFQALPLVAPVDNYHVASGFGIRKDPFTKRRAMHFGADLAGWFRSPVYATAPGTVVVVGRKARFGKMVEIDHGYGIRTRYGHFNKILVKKGQIVDYRYKIGLLGNTGRSIGPHVHYEILFDGKQIDPLKFIKAGRYVSKS